MRALKKRIKREYCRMRRNSKKNWGEHSMIELFLPFFESFFFCASNFNENWLGWSEMKWTTKWEILLEWESEDGRQREEEARNWDSWGPLNHVSIFTLFYTSTVGNKTKSISNMVYETLQSAQNWILSGFSFFSTLHAFICQLNFVFTLFILQLVCQSRFPLYVHQNRKLFVCLINLNSRHV